MNMKKKSQIYKPIVKKMIFIYQKIKINKKK